MTTLLPNEIEDLRLILAWLRQDMLPDDEYVEIPFLTWQTIRDASYQACERVFS